MSEETNENKSMLLKLCRDLNIPISNSMTTEILESKLRQYISDIKTENITKTNEKEIADTKIEIKDKHGLKLIYCNITCNNPDKQNLQGDIFTAMNDKIEITKTIFFNTPYWVPEIILNSLKEKKYSVGKKHIDKDGNEITKVEVFPEYIIEYLPIPDESYFRALKQRQLAIKQNNNQEEVI